MRYQWNNHVRPADIAHIEPWKDKADVVVDNTEHWQAGLEALIAKMEEKNQILYDALNKLGPPCSKLLLLWANDYSFKEIVKKLHYSTENSAKVQKFKCLKRLFGIMGEDELL